MEKIPEGWYWLKHPVQGVTVIQVKENLVYSMNTIATRMSHDKKIIGMDRVETIPHEFDAK